MVSQLGLLDGLTAIGVLTSSVICGSISLYTAKKLDAKLLYAAGLAMIFSGLFFLGPTTDIILVLATGKNISPMYLYGILSYMWVAVSVLPTMYLGAELIIPDKKKAIVGIYAILGVIFQLFLFLDTINAFIFTLGVPGEDLIDASFNRTHPTYFFILFFLLSTLIFCGIGFLVKAKQATGLLRKKFLLLSLGYIDFVIAGTLDSLFAPGIMLFFVRIAMMCSPWLIYIGLKA
ncbi:MAG: hypothetical protein EU532_10790 [Promethearchaeota archaeon]|nr:MAG: hypothetical protein EU532_10790 [Candidatus Lokiarchaeota archaeon]